MLLLNIPPMPNGKLNEADVARLEELGTFLRKKYEKNLAKDAHIDIEEKKAQMKITAKWDALTDVSAIVLKEDIRFSQRVEKYRVFAQGEVGLELIYEGTTIGFRKIISINKRKTNTVIVEINDFRVKPVLFDIEIY